MSSMICIQLPAYAILVISPAAYSWILQLAYDMEPNFWCTCYSPFFFYSDHQAVYGTLFEAEHRSTFYIPYWNLPLARWIVPRQRKFQADLKVINDCLDELIKNAKETRQVQYTW